MKINIYMFIFTPLCSIMYQEMEANTILAARENNSVSFQLELRADGELENSWFIFARLVPSTGNC